MEKLKSQQKKMEPRSSSPLTKETLDHSTDLDKATLKVMEGELTHELLKAILESFMKQPFSSLRRSVALKDPRMKISFDMDSDVYAPNCQPCDVIDTEIDGGQNSGCICCPVCDLSAIDVFDSLQPKPSFLREDNLVNRANIPANKELRAANNCVKTVDLNCLEEGNWLDDKVH